MTTFFSILIAVLAFSLIIFVHELGHFVAAKLSGITVLQFSLGFGPALIKKKLGDTVYAVRAIPLGGAVMMKGADEEEELLVGQSEASGDSEAGSYYSVPKWKRLLVVSAGPVMNLLCGILILFFIWLPFEILPTPVISGLMEGFAYDDPAHFQAGDRLVNVNGFHVFTPSDVTVGLASGEGRPMRFKIERAGRILELENLDLKPAIPDPQTGRMLYGFQFEVRPGTVAGTLGYAARNAMSYLQSAIKGLQMLITGQAGMQDMMGTVGIAGEISQRTRVSAAATWDFIAFISVNLALMNLLPLPALDGGKILFLGIEAVRGKRINAKLEGLVSMVSLLLLLGLFVVVTYNDIARIIRG